MTTTHRRDSSLRRWLASTVLALAGSTQAATLEADLAELLREEGLTGAVWGLLDASADTPHHTLGAAGWADAGQRVPMRVDHRVQAGSIAKPVLALAVQRLATQGRLRLDDPLAAHLQEPALHNPWQATHPLRVRHLLDHTAGLPNLRLGHLFTTRATPDDPLAAVFAHDPLLTTAQQPPGTQFAYSNLGYTLAGVLIERVSGLRYETVLEREVLQPLGMADSAVTHADQHTDPRLAMSHFGADVAHPSLPLPLRPAMQLRTTAADALKLALAVMDAPPPPAPTAAVQAGLPVGYALGWGWRDRHGHLGLCHGGDTLGFRALLCVYPAARKASFIAVNADAEDANYERLHARLMAALHLPTEAAVPVLTGAAARAAVAAAPAGLYWPAHATVPELALWERASRLRWLGAATGGEALTWRPLLGGTARTLYPLGGGLWRQQGRVLASHHLAPQAVLTDDWRSHRRLSTAAAAAVAASALAVCLGALAMLGLGARAAWRRARRRPVPAGGAMMAAASSLVIMVGLPLALLAAQPTMSWAEPRAGALALWALGWVLPAVCVWAAWRHVRLGAYPGVVALLAVLQGVVAAMLAGAWPLKLWA